MIGRNEKKMSHLEKKELEKLKELGEITKRWKTVKRCDKWSGK